MSYPEPSRADHNAPWNLIDIEDDDGETTTECGCTFCNKARLEAYREESGYYDDLFEQQRDRRLGL